MFRHTDWAYWFNKKPEGSGHQVLRDRILAAYIEQNGNMPKVFKALEISAYSFYNYVRKLGLQGQIIALREALNPNARKARPYADHKPTPKAEPVITSGPSPAETSGTWSV